jgi:hypothetical protein
MKVIRSLEEAEQLALPFLSRSSKFLSRRSSRGSSDKTSFQKNISEGPWEMTTVALKRTLNYVFNHLHFACYLLCSDGNHIEFAKLENVKTSPQLKEKLNFEIKKLSTNTTLALGQVQTIKNFVKNTPNLRVLQCVLKPISDIPTTSSEYEDFFNKLLSTSVDKGGEKRRLLSSTSVDKGGEKRRLLSSTAIPSGVYLLNLTDAHLLRRDNTEPFLMYRGKPPLLPEDFKDQRFLPILSLSGNENYWDIPIPNYDDVDYVEGRSSYDIGDFTTNWADKTKNVAVFRGGPSGCGYTTETNTRIKLSTMKSPLLDVGIVSNKKTIDSQSIRFDPVHGLGMMNTGLASVPRLSYVQQSQFKYIIHVDGNVNAYRLVTLLATGSVVLRVKSVYLSWIDSVIQPKVHYISIRSDLSNLVDTVNWCQNHQAECEEISVRAQTLARQILTTEYIQNFVVNMFRNLRAIGRKSSNKSSERKSSNKSNSSSGSERNATNERERKSSNKSSERNATNERERKSSNKSNSNSESERSDVEPKKKSATTQKKKKKAAAKKKNNKTFKNPNVPFIPFTQERDKCDNIKAQITEKLKKKLGQFA